MTAVDTRPDLAGSQRLLACGASSFSAHQARLGPVPRLDLDHLVTLTEESGLTGRGGAGFPTGIKLRAVAEAGRRGVVVGNAMEGEPLSHKDAVLLSTAPHLVLDGLAVLEGALGARHAVLGVGPDIDPRPVRAALAERSDRIEVRHLEGGFVAGQETALVNQLEGRPAVPRDPATRVTERGHSGHPTLVVNAETLAQLALLARYGAGWFRSIGTPDDPGTSLFTVSGAVSHPGVLEAARGTPLRHVLARAGAVDPVAVLVGGYHGAWLPPEALDTPLTRAALAPYQAAVGAGVVFVLGPDVCPLEEAATVVRYLADESAGQCGPCINGLPAIARSLLALAHGSRDPRLPAEIDRLCGLVVGRGACAHPDGSARFVGSTLRTFWPHVQSHLAGSCPTTGAPLGRARVRRLR